MLRRSGASLHEGRRIEGLTPDLQLDNLRVVLVSIRNPLNIGAAARAMSNFGVSRLRVVNPYDAAFREARSAVGAAEQLKNAEEFTTVAEAVADCSLVIGTTAGKNRELQHPLLPLQSTALQVRQRLGAGNVALLFGSERRGLSNDDLSHCHLLTNIPTHSDNFSMNLGQAVAVCLYEIARQGSDGQGSPEIPMATSAEIDRLAAVFLDALGSSGYLNPRPMSVNQEKMRRLIRRLHINSRDVIVLTGMLRKIAWKIHSKE
jgi:TrmH family RNA methyltransferase